MKERKTTVQLSEKEKRIQWKEKREDKIETEDEKYKEETRVWDWYLF